MLNKTLFMIATIFIMAVANPASCFAEPRGGNGHGGGDNHESTPLSEDEVNGLLFMREEEKLARDSYLTLGGLWSLAIFDNIATSEQSHMDAIKKLIDKYELPDPVIPGIGEFNNDDLQALYKELMAWGNQSLIDGLYVGTTIEETDMIAIQHAIDLAGHEDIISTYETLMCGSRNHLRAFVRQIEANGGVYDPADDYFENSDEFFLEIAYSAMERRCGRKY